MSLTLTLIITIVALLCILFGCANSAIKDRKKITELESELAEQKQNVAYLVKHIEEVSRIKADEKYVSEKIEGAKTDEEIADILSAIISSNNARVQNNKAGK